LAGRVIPETVPVRECSRPTDS